MAKWIPYNRFGGVMVTVLAWSAVDRGCESQSGQIKDYKIGICCFSTKHALLRSKSRDWLALNQDNVSSAATCIPADNSYFSELGLERPN
jgi:hypothetical protein